jgi:hypothetical protein
MKNTISYDNVAIGDVCLVKLSTNTKNLCGGHKMFKMEGKTIEALCLYAKIYQELYFTDDGITYTSKAMKSKVIRKLGNIFDNLKDSHWREFYDMCGFPEAKEVKVIL